MFRLLVGVLCLVSWFGATAQTQIDTPINTTPMFYTEGSGAPVGNCNTSVNYGALYFDHTNLILYSCATGGWTQAGSSSTGTFSNGVISGTPSTAAQLALPTGSHGFVCDEASTAGVPAANVDYLRCDSTSHTIKASYNGGVEGPLIQGYGNPVATIASHAGLTANLGTTLVYTSTEAGWYEVCLEEITTTAATSSSSLPALNVQYTSALTGAATTPIVLIFANTSNFAGVGNVGCGVVHTTSGTAINISTSGYASSGAQALTYAIDGIVYSRNADGK